MKRFLTFMLGLAIAAVATAQQPSCWPKDLDGGTGSTAIVLQAPLASGTVRETDRAQCAAAWACSTTYAREIEVAVFDRCSAPVDQLRQATLAALADARAAPAYAELVTNKCDSDASDATLALCKQARSTVLADKTVPRPPAFAASAPTLYDSAGAVSKDVQAIAGAACACDNSSRRLSVKGELRCELASAKAPPGLYAACDRK